MGNEFGIEGRQVVTVFKRWDDFSVQPDD